MPRTGDFRDHASPVSSRKRWEEIWDIRSSHLRWDTLTPGGTKHPIRGSAAVQEVQKSSVIAAEHPSHRRGWRPHSRQRRWPILRLMRRCSPALALPRPCDTHSERTGAHNGNNGRDSGDR